MDDESTRELLADIERSWGGRTRFPPEAIELPHESTLLRRASADAGACPAVRGRWLQRPGFDILDARVTGAIPRDRFIYVYFELDLRLRGHLACEGGCANGQADTRVAYDVMLPVSYRIDTFQLLLPRYIKWAILLRSLIVGGARVVQFVRDNRELVELIGQAIAPTIDIVWRSADLICQGAFNPGVLREHIRRQLREQEVDPSLIA